MKLIRQIDFCGKRRSRVTCGVECGFISARDESSLMNPFSARRPSRAASKKEPALMGGFCPVAVIAPNLCHP